MIDNTMAGCKDSKLRIEKLNIRKEIIEDQIRESKDRLYILESEIVELMKGDTK